MARRYFGRRRERRRSVRHNRRGAVGRRAKPHERILKTITERPLKTISVATGVGAVADLVFAGGDYSVAGCVAKAIQDGTSGAPNAAQAAMADLGGISGAIGGAVFSPSFLGLAATSVVSGVLSKKFRI